MRPDRPGPDGFLAWQWCNTEKIAAWKALLDQVPAPDAVVVDGGPGLLAALRACWPEARVQRCLVHVQRDVRRHLDVDPAAFHANLRAVNPDVTIIEVSARTGTGIRDWCDWLTDRLATRQYRRH